MPGILCRQVWQSLCCVFADWPSACSLMRIAACGLLEGHKQQDLYT